MKIEVKILTSIEVPINFIILSEFTAKNQLHSSLIFIASLIWAIIYSAVQFKFLQRVSSAFSNMNLPKFIMSHVVALIHWRRHFSQILIIYTEAQLSQGDLAYRVGVFIHAIQSHESSVSKRTFISTKPFSQKFSAFLPPAAHIFHQAWPGLPLFLRQRNTYFDFESIIGRKQPLIRLIKKVFNFTPQTFGNGFKGI